MHHCGVSHFFPRVFHPLYPITDSTVSHISVVSNYRIIIIKLFVILLQRCITAQSNKTYIIFKNNKKTTKQELHQLR